MVKFLSIAGVNGDPVRGTEQSPAYRRLGVEANLSLERVALTLITCFLVAFLLDPGGGLGLKYFASLIVFVWLAALPRRGLLPVSFVWLEFPIFFVMPLIAALHGVANDAAIGEVFGAISFSLTWLIFPLTILARPEKVVARFSSTMTVGALVYIFVFIALYALLISGQLERVVEIGKVMSSLRMGYFGVNPESQSQISELPNVYFRWALLLIPTVLLVSGHSKRKFIVVLLACLASMSTGLILFAGLALASFYGLRFLHLNRQRTGIGMALVVLGFALAAAFLLFGDELRTVWAQLAAKLSAESYSTSVKLGHIQSVNEVLGRNQLSALFGVGAGTEFFSVGSNKYVVNVEVSHWNMARQFGAIYLYVFTCYVFLILFRLWNTNQVGQKLSIGLLMLYFAAGTNPLLMSPVFLIPLVMARGYIHEHKVRGMPG